MISRMLRAALLLALLPSCAATSTTAFVLTVSNVSAGPVTGASGEYEAAFSAGWARVSKDEPLFVPGVFADERLQVLGTEGDALGYIGTAGAPFPEDLAATYAETQLHPGDVFVARFDASPGMQLSLGCMFGQSNDTIAGAPAFDLFDGLTPVQGELSAHLAFYDLGAEVNEEPGFGAHQPARGTGGTPENEPITRIDGTDAQGYAYPDVTTLLRVELAVETKR